MKLVSFTVAGRESFGILTAQGVIDVGAHARQRFGSLADALVDMDALGSYAARARSRALVNQTLAADPTFEPDHLYRLELSVAHR